jgi:16S rRNA (uracil1498-N3)-methyltransferase
MSRHTLYLPDLATPTLPEVGSLITVTGEEAHHAIRVKRLEGGDRVSLQDGRGHVCDAIIRETLKSKRTGEWEMQVEIAGASFEPPLRPMIRVASGVPKGEGLEQLIDGLSQVGARSWAPLISLRSVVDPREQKLKRLERIAEEAMKQCGRRHLLIIGDKTQLVQAMDDAHRIGMPVLVAAQEGAAYRAGATPLTECMVMVGPEGGWDTREMQLFRERGARLIGLGPNTMRIEVAAAAACAIIMHEERSASGVSGRALT